MRTLLTLLFALSIAASASAQTSDIPLISMSTMRILAGDTRCGNYMILTENTSSGPSILFTYEKNGQELAKIIPLEHATLTADGTGKVPTVSLPNTGPSAIFHVSQKEMEKVKKCFPPPATITAP